MKLKSLECPGFTATQRDETNFLSHLCVHVVLNDENEYLMYAYVCKWYLTNYRNRCSTTLQYRIINLSVVWFVSLMSFSLSVSLMYWSRTTHFTVDLLIWDPLITRLSWCPLLAYFLIYESLKRQMVKTPFCSELFYNCNLVFLTIMYHANYNHSTERQELLLRNTSLVFLQNCDVIPSCSNRTDK